MPVVHPRAVLAAAHAPGRILPLFLRGSLLLNLLNLLLSLLLASAHAPGRILPLFSLSADVLTYAGTRGWLVLDAKALD
jgi:hypothetical protein